jgi:hypothetical protein
MTITDIGEQKLHIFWQRVVEGGSTQVEGAVFNLDLEQLSSPLKILNADDMETKLPDSVLIHGNQTVVIAISESAGKWSITGRTLCGEEWVTPPYTIQAESDSEILGTDVSEILPGILTVCWASESKLLCSIFTESGEILESEILINDSFDFVGISYNWIVDFNDGTFVVVWKVIPASDTNSENMILLQKMNMKGGRMWGLCNNRLCDENESCESCPKDCGTCLNDSV